jgi:carbonic anhydrase/acetyltransferase-like protein (isoleucine patch superfamily)
MKLATGVTDHEIRTKRIRPQGGACMIMRIGDKAPHVCADSWIADNATIVGNVRVGHRTGIWFGAVARADVDAINIGDETNVQDNCVLHAALGAPLNIGHRVSVGHGAVLHGCTVESDVLVGMGATVLNHAHVGRGSLVAAGTLLLEGSVVPPGSLVAGVPGTVRRALSDEEQNKVRQNARTYVELARRYASTAETSTPRPAP